MGSRSDAVVATLMSRDARCRNREFAKAMTAISDSTHFYRVARSVIPDAYIVDDEDCRVVIYEVVDSNPITPEKADRIAEMSDELDDIGWSLLVVTLDYTGHVTSELDGWAYFPAYTEMVVPGANGDMTPAARAVARARESSDHMTPEELLEALNRIP